MKASKRAALELIMKRYTKARTLSAEVARAALVDEGIFTSDGKISADYGGEIVRKSSPAKR